jgi:hypothetical protein
LVDDQERRVVPPGLIDDGDALSVTVGATGEGMGAADGGVADTGFLLQPAKAAAKVHKPSRRTDFRRLPCSMKCLLERAREAGVLNDKDRIESLSRKQNPSLSKSILV